MGEKNGVSQPEIVVKNVTMQFRRVKDEATSLKELMIRKLRGAHRYELFTALDDISFHVEKGEVAGIIGTNGSGKSTLLKIISGVLVPTRGEVLVDRRKVQVCRDNADVSVRAVPCGSCFHQRG